MSSLPDDYYQALVLLARASARYRRDTGLSVIIVGGAAASFYTNGAILSGDVDMVADIRFESYMLDEGFLKEARPGRLLRGFYHPDIPRLGFELVSKPLFDGLSDRDKLLAVVVEDGKEVLFPAIEDLIADRLGQYAATDNKDPSRAEQAKLMMALAVDCDREYLCRRIKQEGGDPAVVGLEDA